MQKLTKKYITSILRTEDRTQIFRLATSNFQTGDTITLTEMIADKLRQQGITNVSVARYGEQFKTFADGYKFIRESDLYGHEDDYDWSSFNIREYIVTEIILDTMAFYRGGEAAWVRIIKHPKPNLEVMYLLSVIDE